MPSTTGSVRIFHHISNKEKDFEANHLPSTRFGLYLIYSQLSVPRKIVLVTLYIIFLFISVVPVIFEATLPSPSAGRDPWNDRRGFAALYWNTHAVWVHPIVTVLSFAALYPQLREISVNPGALSMTGLRFQAAVFFLVGLSWKFRITT
jgi:hypothetical protein